MYTKGLNEEQGTKTTPTTPVPQTTLLRDMVKGSVIGLMSATTMFPIDKITFVFMTLKGENQVSVLDAAKRAFKWPNTFNGYLPGLVSTLSKNAVVFSSKGEIERKIDGRYSAFVAGLLGVYLTSPLAVIKALAFNNQPVSETLSKLNYAEYFRGVHTKAFCDSMYFGVYLNALPMIKDALNNSPEATDLGINNSFVTGSIAGFTGAFFSNPLAMITMGQKVNGTSPVEEAKSLYQDGGISRFYRGFFRTNALRMTAQGAVVAIAIEMVDKMQKNHSPSPSPNSSDE